MNDQKKLGGGKSEKKLTKEMLNDQKKVSDKNVSREKQPSKVNSNFNVTLKKENLIVINKATYIFSVT